MLSVVPVQLLCIKLSLVTKKINMVDILSTTGEGGWLDLNMFMKQK